jgi:hypothetical protein
VARQCAAGRSGTHCGHDDRTLIELRLDALHRRIEQQVTSTVTILGGYIVTVIASEAKQSNRAELLDCFVTSLLAMTDHEFKLNSFCF